MSLSHSTNGPHGSGMLTIFPDSVFSALFISLHQCVETDVHERNLSAQNYGSKEISNLGTRFTVPCMH